MRPLTITAEDRVAPPRTSSAKSRRKPAAKPVRKKAATGKRASAARRKPLPTWFRPAAFAAVFALLLSSLAGAGIWLWKSGFAEALADRINQTAERTVAGLGLTVREITVAGRRHTQVDQILEAVGVGRGDIIL